jgi:hypothetical protein
MSFVVTVPELLSAAAGRLQVIGAAVSAANATAAFPITGVIPAAADEVSAATAAAFSGYGQLYQAISAEAAAIHEEFVKALGLGANSYATTEAANAMQAGGGLVAVPGAPARPAAPAPRPVPTAPARPAAPARRPVPAAPARPAPAAPARMPAQVAPAAPGTQMGYRGGYYGGHGAPYRGGYYGGHTTPYGGGYRGGHVSTAAPVQPLTIQPTLATPAVHPATVEHFIPATPTPAVPVRA